MADTKYVLLALVLGVLLIAGYVVTNVIGGRIVERRRRRRLERAIGISAPLRVRKISDEEVRRG